MRAAIARCRDDPARSGDAGVGVAIGAGSSPSANRAPVQNKAAMTIPKNTQPYTRWSAPAAIRLLVRCPSITMMYARSQLATTATTSAAATNATRRSVERYVR